MKLFRKIVISSACLTILGGHPAVAEPSCLPVGTDYLLLSSYQSEDGLYSRYFGENLNIAGNLFITLENNGNCELLVSPEDVNAPEPFLDSYLPEDIAKNLYHNQYEMGIELAGGLEEYQANIDSSEGTDDEAFKYISPAEEWALTELGIRLPEDAVVGSIDPEVHRVYYLLSNMASPAFGADEIGNIRFSSEYILADYVMDDVEGVVFAKLLDSGGIEYIFSGPKDEYNPEIISRDYLLPLRIFEGFEE